MYLFADLDVLVFSLQFYVVVEEPQFCFTYEVIGDLDSSQVYIRIDTSHLEF